MVRHATLLVALVPTALAFSGTHPIVAWTSYSSDALTLASKSADSAAFLESLLSDGSVCSHDAVVLVEQMGLHASDLRSLSSSSKIAQAIMSAPASLEMPYMHTSGESPFGDVTTAIAERCGSRILSVSVGEVEPHLEGVSGKKHVLNLVLPSLEGTSEHRKQLMAEHESKLVSELEKITNAFAKHVVIYAGWDSLLQARQDVGLEGPALEFAAVPITAAPSTAVAPEGGILKRYQLLTPGLIVSLFVGLFVLLPVVFLGISSLASIQSPVRLDAPKGFNAADKKNQ